MDNLYHSLDFPLNTAILVVSLSQFLSFPASHSIDNLLLAPLSVLPFPGRGLFMPSEPSLGDLDLGVQLAPHI